MDATLNATVAMSATLEVDEKSNVTDQAQGAAEDLYTRIAWPKWVQAYRVNAIRNLRCFENVRSMVVNYMPLPEVARQIHSMGELKDLSVESVRQYLEHYKATIPPAMIVRQIRPHVYDQSVKKLESEINTVQDMNRLKNMMFQRLDMILEREKAMGFPLPQAEKQYQVAMEIVSKLDDMMHNRISVPAARPDEGMSLHGFDLDKIYNRPGLNDAVKDPASRLRVMKFMENVINYYGKEKEGKEGKVITVKEGKE